MKLYFVSKNPDKIKEVKAILGSDSIEVLGSDTTINEIQSPDINEIVKDKVLKAFKQIKRTLIVEHTGLYIQEFGNLPGGLTQVFWDSLGAEGFCRYFGGLECTAKTVVAYCNGKGYKLYEGTIEGRITKQPGGTSTFQWDPVFIPNGYDQTFAEMSPEKKNEISMRKKALTQLKNDLEKLI